MSTTDPLLTQLKASCLKVLLDSEFDKLVTAIAALQSGQQVQVPSGTDLSKPISIYGMFKVAIGANTNFKAVSLVPQNAPCIFRIYVALSVAGVFSVQRTVGGVTVTENLNSGIALTANASYMFDILVDNSESINFQTTVAATILKLSVIEKDDAA